MPKTHVCKECDMCGAPINVGDSYAYCCGDWSCSQECLDKSFFGMTEAWPEHYTSDGDCYWTVQEECDCEE